MAFWRSGAGSFNMSELQIPREGGDACSFELID